MEAVVTIDYAGRLARLTPIKELNSQNLTSIVEQSQLEDFQPGDKIAAMLESEWLLYLIEGRLTLFSRAETAQGVEGGSARANLPIFAERNTNDYAVVETAAKILRFDKALFDRLLKEQNLTGYQVVADVEIQDYEGHVFQHISRACQAKQLDLPSMPEVALRIRKMADDPDVGISELAKIVQTDPVVAAVILNSANSPLFQRSGPVNTVKDAVVRLGVKTTQNLAISLAMRKTFKAKSPLVKQRMHELWEHSVNVSALSYVIARDVGGFDPDRALLAGLLHDIGAVPILNYLDKEGLSPSTGELEATIQKLRGMVGVLVLNSWGFDPQLITVLEESDNWMRDTGLEADYCDIVLVAQLYSYLDTPRAINLPQLSSTPAFNKLKLGGLDTEGNLTVLEEAGEEIAEIKRLLSA